MFIEEILKEEKYEVLAFLDKNAENIVEKNGTPCYLPTDPKSVEMKNAIVLISLFLSDQEAESLKEDIKVMGYENVLFDKNHDIMEYTPIKLNVKHFPNRISDIKILYLNSFKLFLLQRIIPYRTSELYNK